MHVLTFYLHIEQSATWNRFQRKVRRINLYLCLIIYIGFCPWPYAKENYIIRMTYMDLFTSCSWLDERSSSTMLVRPPKAWPSTWDSPHLDIETLCKLISPRLENWRALKMGIEFPDMFKAAKKKIWMRMRCEKESNLRKGNFWLVYILLL